MDKTSHPGGFSFGQFGSLWYNWEREGDIRGFNSDDAAVFRDKKTGS